MAEQSPKPTTRSFTYADIAAFITGIHASLEGGRFRYEIRRISLLSELMQQPVWVVDIAAFWDGKFSYVFTLHITESYGYQGQPRLDVLHESDVPPSCATIAEEDTAIAAHELARQEEMQRQYEAIARRDGAAKSNDTAE